MEDNKDDELRNRFKGLKQALQGRIEMTKPGVEPIKDKTQDKKDKT